MYAYCVTKHIFKPWHEFLALGALLLQVVLGRASQSPSISKPPLRGSERGCAARHLPPSHVRGRGCSLTCGTR